MQICAKIIAQTPKMTLHYRPLREINLRHKDPAFAQCLRIEDIETSMS